MAGRKRSPSEKETRVLLESGRRCCLCYGLNSDFSVKQGQIAHLDRNPANDNLDNLAFLCLEHHDAYDGKTSQSKGYTIHEVKWHRSVLVEEVAKFRKENAPALTLAGKNPTANLEERTNKVYVPRIVDEPEGYGGRGVLVVENGVSHRLMAYDYYADTPVNQIYPDLCEQDSSGYGKDGNGGLTWGYGGTGPSWTAYSILRDLVGIESAGKYWPSFAAKVIERLPQRSNWVLTSVDILRQLDFLPND